MFFLTGAASSVLDILGSLQGASGAQHNSAANGAATSQSPFSIPASVTAGSGAGSDTAATSAGPAGSTGGWSRAETMNVLLSAQSQSGTGPSGANANVWANGPDAAGPMTMPPGFLFSPPFSWSSNGSATLAGFASEGTGTQPFNPLGRLLNRQAQLFAVATAGQGLSTTA